MRQFICDSINDTQNDTFPPNKRVQDVNPHPQSLKYPKWGAELPNRPSVTNHDFGDKAVLGPWIPSGSHVATRLHYLLFYICCTFCYRHPSQRAQPSKTGRFGFKRGIRGFATRKLENILHGCFSFLSTDHFSSTSIQLTCQRQCPGLHPLPAPSPRLGLSSHPNLR